MRITHLKLPLKINSHSPNIQNHDVNHHLLASIHLNKESFGKALSYLSDVLPFEEGSEDFNAYNESVAQRKAKADEAEAAAAE